jgi:serine/threonine-protein kinase
VPIQSSRNGLVAGVPVLFLQTPAFETYPAFSPDGKWISYASNESGTWEVYVRQFPDGGHEVRISPNGGRISFWSPNRRELFYRIDDQRIMVATYKIRDGSFSVQSVAQWSQAHLADTGVLANLDLAPDGTKFVYLVPAATPENAQTENHATFISDFFSEITRRVH